MTNICEEIDESPWKIEGSENGTVSGIISSKIKRCFWKVPKPKKSTVNEEGRHKQKGEGK